MKVHQPHFWKDSKPNFYTFLLSPLAFFVYFFTRKKLIKPSCHVDVPVLCIGNITVGGTGKTPLVIDMVNRLKWRGHTPHIITKGYGGLRHKSHKVDRRRDNSSTVGDEALLLAAEAPTWCGEDRVQSALNAIIQGADCLVMDDGFQDPSLFKDVSLLVFDGGFGVGNNLLFPSGPLREPVDSALQRAHGAVIIGDDQTKITKILPRSLPRAHLSFYPRPEIRALQGKQLIAFAGIGRPDKFFDMLHDAGLFLLHTISFPDHHVYSATDIYKLDLLAKDPGTQLVTTKKDAVKLPEDFLKKVTVVKVDLYWQKPKQADQWLDLLFNIEL
ncbi:tetraacyldisaccharide 4'-kinase [Aristophania vespae]|uniref:tetraacyldisaccharide 4'-kinase n=1 Tax=Aristophania vespae TaxID=2697033 RepID=UPI0023519E51|nr:tetraacyldisaccharide 4'-kinase [Aristophania vespae]